MKLVTIDAREVAGRPGVLLESGEVLDLSAAPGSLETSQWIPQSTISILVQGERGIEHAESLVALVDDNGDRLQSQGALTQLSGTALMTPVRRPGLLLISHTLSDGSPASFIKSPNTAVGPTDAISVHGQDAVIANPMFAAVLGKRLYQADEATADSALAAWTLVVDLAPVTEEPETADEWRRYVSQRQSPGSFPMGPALVTRDELEDPNQLTVEAQTNNAASWSGIMAPPVGECVRRLAELSQDYAFSPGDVIAFATARDSASSPRQKLVAGDRFSVGIEGLMQLEFALVA